MQRSDNMIYKLSLYMNYFHGIIILEFSSVEIDIISEKEKKEKRSTPQYWTAPLYKGRGELVQIVSCSPNPVDFEEIPTLKQCLDMTQEIISRGLLFVFRSKASPYKNNVRRSVVMAFWSGTLIRPLTKAIHPGQSTGYIWPWLV
jgi:hypothetical protein